MRPSICQDCEKEARMFEEDNTGFCYAHAIEHSQKEFNIERIEDESGITEFDVSERAVEKHISFPDARQELLAEKTGKKIETGLGSLFGED